MGCGFLGRMAWTVVRALGARHLNSQDKTALVTGRRPDLELLLP